MTKNKHCIQVKTHTQKAPSLSVCALAWHQQKLDAYSIDGISPCKRPSMTS